MVDREWWSTASQIMVDRKQREREWFILMGLLFLLLFHLGPQPMG
jgi:uncharacterized integral membrane protein